MIEMKTRTHSFVPRARRLVGSALLIFAIGGCDSVTVVEVPEEGLIVVSDLASGSSISFEVGRNVQLRAEGAIGKVVWTSSNPTIAQVIFTGQVTGERGGTATITAANQGRTASIEVTITDEPPVAVAMASSETVVVGAIVTLDGGQSFDPEGQDLTYAWTLPSRPGGSQAEITDPTSGTATLRPDVEGDYAVQLIVNDGFSDSPPSAITIGVETPVVTCNLTAGVNYGSTPSWVASPIDRDFALTNGGVITADGNASLSGSCGAFSITAGGGAFTLLPGESRAITVRFQPSGNQPGTQSCTVRTGIPECASGVAQGTGLVSFSQQVTSDWVAPLCESCHTQDYTWFQGATNPAAPLNSDIFTWPCSGSHTGGTFCPSTTDNQAKRIIAWMAQGRPNN